MSTVDHRVRLLPFHKTDSDEVLRHLDRQVIALTIDASPKLHHQIIALTLTSLLGRIFPNIHLEAENAISAHPHLPPGPSTLQDRLAEIRAEGGHPTSQTKPVSFNVHIGDQLADRADVHVTSSGWNSYLGRRPFKLDPCEDPITIGALVAAARAAASIYGVLLNPYLDRDQDVPEHSVWSALTYGPPTDVQLPKFTSPALSAVLVGLGSVGGSAVFALRYAVELNGQLTVVDPQSLEPKNVPKGILASATASALRREKAVVAYDALSHHEGLAVYPETTDITAHHATQDREFLFPLVVSAVDSIESREAIQDCLPVRVINAACTTDQFTVSGHVTRNGPCVCCLHMPDVMNVSETRSQMISTQLGINKNEVDRLLANHNPVDSRLIRLIEIHLSRSPGSLDLLVGKSLNEIWEQNLRYSELSLDDGDMAIVAPFITALAGFLLAGELIKGASYGYGPWTLGPEGTSIKYEEAPLVGPDHGLFTNPPRWHTSACLCQSTRRKRLHAQRSHLG